VFIRCHVRTPFMAAMAVRTLLLLVLVLNAVVCGLFRRFRRQQALECLLASLRYTTAPPSCQTDFVTCCLRVLATAAVYSSDCIWGHLASFGRVCNG
jgi:hypothetical protein